MPNRIIHPTDDTTVTSDEWLERLRLALAFADLGEWTWDATTDAVNLSVLACEILGVEPHTRITWQGMQDELLHPQDVPRAAAAVDLAIRNHAAYRVEYRVRRRSDGREIWVSASGKARYDTDGRALGMIGVLQDITHRKLEELALAEEAKTLDMLNRRAQRELAEKKRAEDDLRALTAQLEQRVQARTAELEASYAQLRLQIEERERAEEMLRHTQKLEAIGQLTGGVAHDFNNLLTIVLGNMDTIARRLGPDADPRLHRAIEHALEGARKAAALTQRLLAFARRQPLQPEPADPNRLVHQMSELLYRTLGERIEIETTLAAGVWTIEVDVGQLESAILNLAVNARDAMPNGGKLTIETANAHIDEAYGREYTVSPGQYVVICVSDTGTGIPRDLMDKVFDPFFTTKTTGQGTGLGLSQVYGFVKQSGGNVRIYSEPGEGTVVKLYLPRYTGNLAVIPEKPVHLLPADRHETILVVEDEERVRQLSVSLLRELGYNVIAAEDGATALALLERLPQVDLLFTDVGLPRMNGRQLVDEARRRHPALKVLFTTGYAKNAIVHHGRLDADVQLIVKPFTFSELSEKVRAVLDADS